MLGKNKLFIYYFVIFLALVICSCATIPESKPIVIPFTIENDHVVIYAIVNGVEGKYIWDTGSLDTHTFTSLENLRQLAENKEHFQSNRYYIDDSIVINSQIIRSKSIIHYFPSHTDPKLEWLTPYLKEKGFDGIIGLSLFNGWWVEVLFSANKIILQKTKPHDYNDFTETMTTFEGPGLFPSEFFIKGTIDGLKINFYLDTGANWAFNFPKSLRKHFGTNYRRIITLDETYYEIPSGNISIMGDVFTNKTIIADEDGDNVLLGLEFIQRYDILFDMRALFDISAITSKRDRLYYKKRFTNTDIEQTFNGIYSAAPNIYGIGIRREEKGFFVFSVTVPGFAYNELGLRPGMIITGFNGRNLAGLELTELSRIFQTIRKEGGTLTVLNANGTESVIKR